MKKASFPFRIIKNQLGVTLMEIGVSLGLSGILILMVLANYDVMNRESSRIKQNVQVMEWTNIIAYVLTSVDACTATMNDGGPYNASAGTVIPALKYSAANPSQVFIGATGKNASITNISIQGTPTQFGAANEVWIRLAVDFRLTNRTELRRLFSFPARILPGGDIDQCISLFRDQAALLNNCVAMGGTLNGSNQCLLSGGATTLAQDLTFSQTTLTDVQERATDMLPTLCLLETQYNTRESLPNPPANCGYLEAGSNQLKSTCTGGGGTVITLPGGIDICRFSAASCPAGFSPYLNWTRTTANSCSSPCEGTITTGAHVWSNTAPERAPMRKCDRRANDAQCGSTGSVPNVCETITNLPADPCIANITQIGCI